LPVPFQGWRSHDRNLSIGAFTLRKFVLVRHQDVSGVSGTGIVAEGVQFSDGRVCMCWLTRQARSMVIHQSILELESIHGHNGATTVRWLEEENRYENQSDCCL
jgi:hypothetical protein